MCVCVCRRRGLKVNADKSKVMALNGEEGLECEVCVDERKFNSYFVIRNFKFIFGRLGWVWRG